MRKLLLGVNIDHVATVRQARGTVYPSPIEAALLAEAAGADSITLHLREDRRHIQDNDVRSMHSQLKTRMNLEMALTDEMLAHALSVLPQDVCLVPERRQEVTTEGGLDVITHFERIREFTEQLQNVGVRVALFIDPDAKQLDAAQKTGAEVVEIHTGAYADAATPAAQTLELDRVEHAAHYAVGLGLTVHAGHGLNVENVGPIAAIDVIQELNIGHAIVARAIFIGLPAAVREMQTVIRAAAGLPAAQ